MINIARNFEQEREDCPHFPATLFQEIKGLAC